jgi:hypothetical protein
MFGKHFHGDDAFQPRVASPIYLAHTPTPIGLSGD